MFMEQRLVHIVSLFFVLSGPSVQHIGTMQRQVRGDPRPYAQDEKMLLSLGQRGAHVAHIPGPFLEASAQREDGAGVAIYNPGCRQDSSALRQACPWREQAKGWGGTRKEAGAGVCVWGGIKLRQGERDLDRKQGERWGRWKDLSPPKDQRRSSRRGPSCCWDTTARRASARYPEEPVGSIVQ